MIILGLSFLFVLLWIFSGYRQGVIRAVLRVILWVVVWYIAIKLSQPIGQYLTHLVSGQFVRTTIPESVVGDGSQFLASGLIFGLIIIIGGLLSHAILRTFKIVRRLPILGWLDGILGALFCGLIGASIAFFVLELLSVVPNTWVQDQFLNTPMLNTILDKTPFLADQIYHWWL
ncbi:MULTISPECIES: CvpA family protein [Leuconostoc]|uniref:Colicin V production protein n=1 Tax=Leuconostoc pseudomesenteroides TaxID=33968 RepID=A0A1X0VBW4_LEUPS|nr:MULTISPECIES: CvpA family protein [Leuconostoc]MCT4420257.1 CvpA family protein [Leuconostoc falkenbergense]MDG9745484.1 CvpA family protein [Leuconostoc falkenbergense]OQJ67672.1 colicin V production protein [Leuconostoc pseudomesenteroides]OQJ70614.1 colicin V production protein [Leuconostoc pseudomesenteroides]OQJ71897.1 colicin V production protein [Leuconostoc pseudomesenteroides]